MKTTDLTKPKETIKDLLIKKKLDITTLLPVNRNVERFIKSALLAITRDEKLQKCSPRSLFDTIIDAAELDLDFTPAKGLAYIVPFWSSKKGCFEAKFMPGYRGFIELAKRSGTIKDIDADLIYSKDVFKTYRDPNPHLVHEVDYLHDRGEYLGAYAIAYFEDGGIKYEVMNKDSIDSIKNRTKSKNKDGKIVGPWITDEGEMRRKTPIRRLQKYLPCSPELEKAMEYDNRATGIEIINTNENGSHLSRTASLAESITAYPEEPDPNPETSSSSADTGIEPPPEDNQKKEQESLVSEKQTGAIYALCKDKHGKNQEEAKHFVSRLLNRKIKSMKELNMAEASHILDGLQNQPETIKEMESKETVDKNTGELFPGG